MTVFLNLIAIIFIEAHVGTNPEVVFTISGYTPYSVTG